MALTPAPPGGSSRIKQRVLAAFIAVLAVGGVAACAEQNFSALQAGIEDRGHYIADVPFFRQEEDSCGPAAIASVVSFWGQPGVDMNAIKERVYLRELRGTLPMDMARYLREEGFRTDYSSGTPKELKAIIRKNLPVICLLDFGFWVYRQPHYVTVIGFDDLNRVFIVHDGLNANAVIGYDDFNKAWDRAGNWMLVAVPAARSPEKKE